MLITDGKLNQQALRHEGIDLLELEQAVREHGVDGLTHVKMAVLEVDGTISVVATGTETIRTRRRFRQRKQQN